MVTTRLPRSRRPCYWIELAADENTVLALEPIKRIVPTTMTRITANITAYSAISWASSSRNTFQKRLVIFHLLSAKYASQLQTSVRRGGDSEENRSWIASEWLACTPNAPRIVHSWYHLVKQTTI